MWIFTVYGFFSVTCKEEIKKPGIKPDGLDLMMVRARNRIHLERLLQRFSKEIGTCEILEWPGRDYPYRILVLRETWMYVMTELVGEMTWTNFKEEAGKRFGHRSKYLDACHRVWGLLLSLMPNSRFINYGIQGAHLSDDDFPRDED